MPIFKEQDLEFTPAEIEFFAEDEVVTIRPNFSLDTPAGTLRGLECDYGPFNPHRTLDVPLWMAIAVHKRKRCDIVRPDWMSIENLEDVFEQEKREAGVFQPLPPHYIEIASMLLKYAKPTFKDELYRTKDLIDSIRKLRLHKIEEGLKALEGPITVKLNNLSCMELNIIRPFFSKALDRFFTISKMPDQTAMQIEQGMGMGGTTTYGSSSYYGSSAGTGSGQQPARQLRRGG